MNLSRAPKIISQKIQGAKLMGFESFAKTTGTGPMPVIRSQTISEDNLNNMIGDEIAGLKEFYQTILDNVNDGIWVTDKNDALIYLNPGIEKNAGIQSAEVLGKKVTRDFPPETIKYFIGFYEEAKRDLKAQKYEAEIVTPSGRQTVQSGWLIPRLKDGEYDGMLCTAQDITEKKRAEEKLRASEQILDQTGQMAQIGGWEHDLVTGKAVWTRTLYDLIGIDPSVDPPGVNDHLSYYPPKYRKVLEEAYTRSINDGTPFDLELQCYTVDNELRWFRVFGKPVFENGKCVKMRGTVQDITEQMEAELALSESERRYQHLFNTMLDGFAVHEIICDEKGKPIDYRFLKINPAFEKLTGLKASEVIGKTAREVLPKIEDYWIDTYGKVALTGVSIRFENYTGALNKYFEVVAFSPKKNQFATVFTDITERRIAEEQLKASERKYSQLVQQSPDIIVSLDREGRFKSYNLRAELVTGYSQDEVIGKQFTEIGLLTKESIETGLEEFEAIIGGLKRPPFLLTIITKQGNRVILEANARQVSFDNDRDSVQVVLRDVTERIYFEQHLSNLNQSLEAAQEMARIGYWSYNLETRRPEWSRMRFKIFGLNPEDGAPEFEGYRKFIHPDDWDIFEKAIAGCQDGNPYDLTLRIIHPDRTVHNVRTQGFPRYNETGKITELYGTTQDITDIKEAEKNIRLSEEKYKSLYELSPDGIILIDRESRILSVNKRMHEWLEYGEEYYLGKLAKDLSFIDPASHFKIEENFRKRLNGEQVPAYEIVLLGKSGQEYIAQISGTLIRLDEPLCMLILRDVTEQRRIQEELRKSETRYRSVVDNMAIGVTLVDPDMRVQALNRQMKKWYPEVDFSGNPHCFCAFNDPPREDVCTYCPVTRTFKDGQVHESITETPAGDEIRNYRILSAPIKGEDGSIESVIEVTEDITDRLKMEKELLKAEKLESIGILAGGIAHDFNNILVAILGNISLAKLNLGPDSEVFGLLSKAENASERARDLTQQLLTFSRGGEPIKKIANVQKLLKETVSFSLHGASVIGEYNIEPELFRVEVDVGQFSQVVNNLIINAIQAMPRGGTIFVQAANTRVTHPSRLPLDKGDYVRISITDQGHGIPPEIMKKIFDPFFTTKANGNGLGLASCYSIIKKHGGHIDVESVPGKGTTFTLYLPATEKPEEVISNEAAGLASGKGRILVIDDDEWVCKLASNILGKMGFEVSAASNGEEALDLFRQAREKAEPFDAAMIDLTIPGGIGGKDIIRALHDIDPELKAIVSSGYSNDPVMARYEDYGFCGRLAKPYRASDLSNVIGRIMKIAPTRD